jgi:hypothetical protein
MVYDTLCPQCGNLPLRISYKIINLIKIYLFIAYIHCLCYWDFQNILPYGIL